MIDDSDICVVYYDENYLPLRRKNSPRDISDYQPKSGTRIAYEYAIKKEKRVINTSSHLREWYRIFKCNRLFIMIYSGL